MYACQCLRSLGVTQSEIEASCALSLAPSEMAVMTFESHCIERTNYLHAPIETGQFYNTKFGKVQ